MFDFSQFGDYFSQPKPAGEFFQPTKRPISASELPQVTISGYTVTFNFPRNKEQETKALLIQDEGLNARDYVSVKVSFTDYEPSATVRPKMSQPGQSFRF